MAGPIPPFAFFVTAEVDGEFLNDALTRAYKGNFEAAWEQYLATDNYQDAPRRVKNAYPEGTKAPIPANFSSPFVGKTLEDCAKWLQEAPDDVALNREYFTAVDNSSREDDTIQICRVIGKGELGNIQVECFPVPTAESTIQMSTSLGVKFDEALQRYQRNRMRDGKPDRSKGVPYKKG
ncbi:hypothetical protein UCREL1_1676 [Eutypa lata UCREL1]|uniref:Uncharacterized protein n=1 Tax=Eutypa lata (strain UCR-EL1) TaxID=1287681 RepID=M7T3X0_EUTLA|nr:hypothetical protein UCREL1_1676 [Eutypa lata UCREL1]